MTNTFEEFRVIAVSKNANSFGLKHCVMVSKAGVCLSGCANSLNVPKENVILFVPYYTSNGLENYHLEELGFELTERLADCPKDVVIEIFRH